MVINTNVSTPINVRLLAESNSMLAQSLAKLSSGTKIVSRENAAARPADSMRLDAQGKPGNATDATVGNALSFHQTEKGFLEKISQALDRMSELSIQGQKMTKTDSDRSLDKDRFSTLAAYVASTAG